MNRIHKIEDYEIIEQGSVANLRGVEPYTDTKMGKLILEFTDDTSVKDFGKLGFETPRKGESMTHTAVYNFEQMTQMGVPHIFKEQVAPNAIMVDWVRKMNPDEIDLTEVRTNRLFPIEVITRDVITATSSAAKRLVNGTLSYQELGLSEMPTEFPIFLPKTYVDGSTKLRVSGDDYLPWDQLKTMAYATTADINAATKYVLATTELAQRRGSEIGVLVFDHKDEYAYNEKGDLILADKVLCLDEITCALVGPYRDLDHFRNKSFNVFQAGINHSDDAYVNASKQLFRDHYDAEHPKWVKKVKEALKGTSLPPAPQPPSMLVELASEIYQAFANEWTGEQKFDVPSLEKCVRHYKIYAQQFYELRTE